MSQLGPMGGWSDMSRDEQAEWEHKYMSSAPSGPKKGHSICPTVAWGGKCEPACRTCRERAEYLESLRVLNEHQEAENYLPERRRPIPVATIRDVLEVAACWAFIWPVAKHGPPFQGFFAAGILSFVVLLFMYGLVIGLFRAFIGPAGDSYLRRMMNGDMGKRA